MLHTKYILALGIGQSAGGYGGVEFPGTRVSLSFSQGTV